MRLINIYNKGRVIYLFKRDAEGRQFITKESSFYPYYFESSNEEMGNTKSITGIPVRKIIVSDPKDIRKNRTNKAWEADLFLCLSPNTWIRMANGEIKKLNDVKQGEDIISCHIGHEFSKHKIIDKWESYKIANKIITNSQDIVASNNHKFLTLTPDKKIDNNNFEWKEVRNLKINDSIIQWMNYEKELSDYRDDWFYLMGFYHGDGAHFSDNRNDFEIFDNDKSNLETLKTILSKYKITSKIKKSKYCNMWILSFNSLFVNQLKHKKLPYDYPIEYKLSFIAGVFDAEGCVNLKGYCSITNIDEKLIYWMSNVLFSVGLPNGIHGLEKYGRNGWTMNIYDIIKFKEILKIKSNKKYQKLLKAINSKQNNNSKRISNFDVLPIGFILRQFAKFGDLSGKDWISKRKYFNSYQELNDFYKNLKCLKHLHNIDNRISRFRALEIYKEIQEKSFKKGYVWLKLNKQINFILKHVFCSKIKEIEAGRKQKVIDITIKNTHNFIANNFASHNCQRYMIDKVDVIEKCPIKWAMLDIETLSDELPDVMEAKDPVTCITIYNNFSKEYKTYYIKDYETEYKMMDAFIEYIKKESFDLLSGWNIKGFDMPYMCNRYPDFAKRISPINETRYGGDIDYPAGISVVDYYSWFKAITLNREESYKLDNIAQKYLGDKPKEEVDFGKISEGVKAKNKLDVEQLVRLEEQKQLIPYFDEIRRLCLSPETWIKMESGDIKKLENIKKGDKIIGTRLSGDSKNFLPQTVIGKREIYKKSYQIITNSQNIVASKEHKFLTLKPVIDKIHYSRFKWDKVENLKPKDILLQWINYNKKPSNYRDDWFYLKGFYFGDGNHYRKDYRLVITDKDKANLKILQTILLKFNTNSIIKKHPQANSYILNAYNPDLRHLKNKSVPINLPMEYQVSFIAGIFDAEGCVNDKNHITIVQKESKLIYWISSVLFSLGLPNCVKKRGSTGFGKNNEHFALIIYDLHAFNELIHIKSPKKLQKLLKCMHQKKRLYFDTLPIVSLLRKLMEYGKLSTGKGWRINRKYFSSYKKMKKFHKNLKCTKLLNWSWSKTENISRSLAYFYLKEIQNNSLVKSFSFKKLNKQIEFILKHVFCAKIRTIKEREHQKLIDIQVTNENFIANNFVSHNSKVEWEDMMYTSRIIDSLLLQEAKKQNIALPMKPHEERGTLSEKEDYLGAYREAFETGLLKDVGSYDLTSAYPLAIKDFCIDPTNIKLQKEKNCIEIDGTYFKQKEGAILPTVVNKLLTLKNDVKQKLSTMLVDDSDYKNVEQQYNAIKGIVNSSYGVFANRFFRLYNKKVASATTFIVRSLLHYIKDKVEEKGYKLLYLDTDGIMVESKENLNEFLNELVQQWGKEVFGKDKVGIEFAYEGHFKKILILALCRYVGDLTKPNGDIKKVVKGVEMRRKDSTVFMKKFQKELIQNIMDEIPKEEIISWIKSQIEDIRNVPLEDIAFPCKLGQAVDKYKNLPIFLRALNNTDNFDKKVGENYYYIYVNATEYETKSEVIELLDGNKLTPSKLKEDWEKYYGKKTLVKDMAQDKKEELINHLEKEGRVTKKRVEVKGRAKDVMAFDLKNKEHIKDVNWERMIERNVLMKLVVIFEALSWDLGEISISEKPVIIKSDVQEKDEIAEYIKQEKSHTPCEHSVKDSTLGFQPKSDGLSPSVRSKDIELTEIEKQIKKLEKKKKELQICDDSSKVERQGFLPEDGGSTPTSSLQNNIINDKYIEIQKEKEKTKK